MTDRMELAQNRPIWREMFAVAAIACAAIFLVAPDFAQARGNDYVRYTIKRGDTLIGLANKYFVSPASYRRVQKINRIPNARRIPVGKVLRVPRNLLKTKDAVLRVARFSGNATIERGGVAAKPKPNSRVFENSIIRTGRGGFLSLRGASSSRVTIPSQSQVRVLRARRILLTDTLDVEFDVVKGRGSFAPPKLKSNGRYRVRTPVAVSAVRGTVFRVAFDEDGNRNLAEVIEGEVALAAGASESAIPEGFGSTATTAGVGALEELLAAPKIIEAGKIQTQESLRFELEPVEGAKGYRVQVARDAGFIEMVAEGVTRSSSIELESIENGHYNVRARAISDTGLEGMPTDDALSFRRQRLGVSAQAEESPLANGFKFVWLQEGEGDARFDFQLWREGEQSKPIVDEIGLNETSLTLTNLEPGTYEWRVGVVKPDPDGLLRVWGEPLKLVVAD